MGAVVAGAVLQIQHRAVRAFRTAGATSPSQARSLETLGVRNSVVFRRLCRRGVFREAAPGAFYLDEDALLTMHRRRHEVALVIGIVIVTGVALVGVVTTLAR